MSTSRQLKLLFIVAAAYWTTSQMIRPVVAMFLVSLGAAPVTIGLVVAIQNFVPLFLAIPAGGLADRFGYRRLLAVGSLGMIGAGALYISAARSPGYVALVAAQMLSGVGELLVWTSAQAYVTQLGERHDNDRNIGYFSLFSAVGQMAGPALGGFATDRCGYVIAFVLFAAMCACLFVSVLALPEHRPATAADKRGRMLSASRAICANREVQVGMIGTFANLFVSGMWTSFYPIYLISTGFAPSIAGLLVAVKGLAQVAARPFLQPISRRLGRSGALIAATGVALLPIAITPLLHSLPFLALAAVVSGVGLGLNLPLTILIMARNTRPEERGVAMGLRLVMNRVALITNPLIFGLVSEHAGPETSFYVSSAVVAVLMAWAAGRQRMFARVSFENEEV